MKKKTSKNVDSTEVLVQIQEQLAMLNNKFDDFINKSLTDLAQALAAQKAAAVPRPMPIASPAPIRPSQHQLNTRPKYAIVCFQCGKDSELPFKPAPGRPVYCAECFAMRKAGNAPKANLEVKPAVEVQTPAPVENKKTSTSKKAVAKKTVIKNAKKKSAKK